MEPADGEAGGEEACIGVGVVVAVEGDPGPGDSAGPEGEDPTEAISEEDQAGSGCSGGGGVT
ncbi:MAG: hypothetical protein RI897_1492 [Verrucomicrobiota bacterium]